MSPEASATDREDPRVLPGIVARGYDLALIGALVLAVPLIVHSGRNQWFVLDEWSFLTTRSLTDMESLLEAHNGHWVTLPVIAYRINFAIFGLHTYLPYQLLVIISHLAIAVLVQRVSIRLGVNGWIATAGAVGFILFGNGVDNIVFAFQISLNASVAIGLLMILLADHAGDRSRDRGVIALAVLGLMTSGVMVAMIAGVFVTILVRRGIRDAVVFVVGPAALFVTWYAVYGGETTQRGSLSETIDFGWRMAVAAFDQLGGNSATGLALVTLAGIGFAGRLAMARSTRSLTPLAVPAGLITTWLVFAGSAAVNRASIVFLFPDAPLAGRYSHVSAALLLPFVLLGIETAHRIFRPLIVPALLILVLGVLANVDPLLHPTIIRGQRDLVIAIAHSEIAPDAPPDLQPLPGLLGSEVTVGWLLQARAAGDVPDLDGIAMSTRLTADGRVALVQDWSPAPRCDSPEPLDRLVVRKGDEVIIHAPKVVTRVVAGSTSSTDISFSAGLEETIHIRVVAGPLEVEFTSPDGAVVNGCLDGATEAPDGRP